MMDGDSETGIIFKKVKFEDREWVMKRQNVDVHWACETWMDEKRFEDRDEEALKVDRNRTALRARRCLTRIVAVYQQTRS